MAAANQLTAGLCLATGQRPAAVCTSKGVRAAARVARDQLSITWDPAS